MAVYDPEQEEQNDLVPQGDEAEDKSLSPEEIAAREDEIASGYGAPGGEWRRRGDQALGRHRDVRDARLAADAKEREDLFNQLGEKAKGLYDADKEAGRDLGFFKNDEKKGLRGRLGRASKKKLALAGTGIVGMLFAGAFGLFSFLNTFRLDQILGMLDQQTFSRFNASFEGRSDKWFRAYLKLRLAEFGGDTDRPGGDNLYFRAGAVDTNNPIHDWYRTMRTSSFEKDLYEKQGIKFVSMVDDQGRFRTAQLIIKDTPINFDTLNGFDMNKLTSSNHSVALGEVNRLGSSFDSFFDSNVFGSNKEARRAIKSAVNENTRSYQVFRRRHLRKDIANMTGVGEWRLFEKTRDKIDNTKIDIQRKIVNKVFSGDSTSMRFLNCLLGGGRCPTSSDPADPDNKVTGTPDGASEGDPGEQLNDNGSAAVDSDGNPLPANSDEVIADTSDAVSRAVKNEAEDLVADEADDLTTRVLKEITEKVSQLMGTPAAVWNWAQKLTAIHKIMTGGALINLVKNARQSQLEGFYAAIGIARDQIKSGELVGDELNDFYAMTKNFGNSEAWSAVASSYNSSAVSAQGATNVSKEEQCRKDYKKSFEEYSWFCDNWKPNGGGTATDITKAYNESVGWMIAPIAAVVDSVNAVKDIPIVGGILTKLGEVFNSVVGAITSKIADLGTSLFKSLGLMDNIQGIIGSAMGFLLNFVGGGPFIDPSQPGFASWLLGGSTASAETTTRASGGMKSTEASYNYSKQLAAAYEQDRLEGMSWSERYLSPDNPSSVTSTLAFSMSNVMIGENMFSKVAGAFTSLPTNMLAVFTPHAKAAPADLAHLAGVDTYDIPRECQELDPLDPNYLDKATNANIGNRTFELLGDSDQFWQAVYNNKSSQDPESIYNCALIDKRVRGGLGYVHGYSDDGGLENGESSGSAAPTTAASTQIVGDPFSPSADVECAEGTNDLGTAHGYNDGNPIDIRLCAIPNVPSTSSESQPGDRFYVQGANGKLIVNSRVSGAVLAMTTAAQADGVALTAASGFRSMAHQQALWNDTPNPTYTGRPGQSNHQAGAAIDFSAGGVKAGSTCADRARAPGNPAWDWLYQNAERFGFKQYSAESWHWDPSPAANRCGSNQ